MRRKMLAAMIALGFAAGDASSAEAGAQGVLLSANTGLSARRSFDGRQPSKAAANCTT